MDDQTITSVLLRKFYEYARENPRASFHFKEFSDMGLTDEQISFNAKYLDDKRLLDVSWNANDIVPHSAQITALGIDVVREPETTGIQYPFVQNNLQIINGDINNSIIAQSAGEQSINISDSFNKIYNQINASEDIDLSTKTELQNEIQEVETHLTEGKIDLDWIKDKLLNIKKKAHWVNPILQSIIVAKITEYFAS